MPKKSSNILYSQEFQYISNALFLVCMGLCTYVSVCLCVYVCGSRETFNNSIYCWPCVQYFQILWWFFLLIPVRKTIGYHLQAPLSPNSKDHFWIQIKRESPAHPSETPNPCFLLTVIVRQLQLWVHTTYHVLLLLWLSFFMVNGSCFSPFIRAFKYTSTMHLY